MIDYNFIEVEADFEEQRYTSWLQSVIVSEEKKEGEITYVFCNDEYLLDLNQRFLDHDTLTDIITFDNSMGNTVAADIFISVERVKDNASYFNVSFIEELQRVMAHGVLHLCGYKDKTEAEAALMRAKENEKLKLFHVER